MSPLPPSSSQKVVTIHNSTTYNLSTATPHSSRPSSRTPTNASASASSSNLLPNVLQAQQSTSVLAESHLIEISPSETAGQAEKAQGSGHEAVRVRVGRRWGKGTRLLACRNAAGVKLKEPPFWVYEQKAGKDAWSVYIYESRNLSKWLGDLPDSLELSKLYIPGTHESLAIHGFPISSCQTYPITTQLEAGHRFLDLRFALKRNILVGYHGLQSQFISAEEVFSSLYEFLKKNPSECIICSVKQENGAKFFEDRMWELLDTKKWLWWDKDEWPTLGEVRGKCVMFCRMGFKQRRGIHPAYWPDNSPEPWEGIVGQKKVVVQDWYSIGSFLTIPEKAALALSLFRPLRPVPSVPPPAVGTPTPIRINFLSGATLLTAFPFVVAKGLGWVTLFGVGVKGVNQRVLDALLNMGGEERMERNLDGDGAIVLMDYYEVPGGLTELLIAWNFIGR